MGFHRASPVKRRIDPSCASQPARQPPALRQPPGGPAVVRRVIPDSCQQVLPRSRPATPAPAGVGQGAPPVPPARPAGTFPGRPVVRCVPERPRVGERLLMVLVNHDPTWTDRDLESDETADDPGPADLFHHLLQITRDQSDVIY